MIPETELQEYRDEIRQQVCTRCVERPSGGPPCVPLGKNCGVELHLPELIESIRQVHSPLLEPYLSCNRRQVCTHCAFLHDSICPCPMEYLGALIVEAVEGVDQRRREQGRDRPSAGAAPACEGDGIQAIVRAYEAGAGTWTGCDWATTFGKSSLDLNGLTAAAAATMAAQTSQGETAADWNAAAEWLRQVERIAAQAEGEATAAVHAAHAGKWREALEHAERAWALEFSTGRPIWHSYPVAWQHFRRIVEAAYLAHRTHGEPMPLQLT
ncbi:MAG: hypothetical protein IT429_07720 [Gemmataceae bacterium]|nr:hypothetical protein [Gemmataceae bacterium]